MKKYLALFVLTLGVLTFVGCGGDEEEGSDAATEEVTEEATEETEEGEEEGGILSTITGFFSGLFGGGDEEAEAGEGADFSEILQAQMPEAGAEVATLETSLGDITVQFYPEEAPLAVENFLTLAKEGYYDGVTFHRVIDDFMIQSGDPSGTGTGGTSKWGEGFPDEISPKLHFYRGALAMANSGPNSNRSQFFIVQNPDVFQNGFDSISDARTDETLAPLEFPYASGNYTMAELFPDSVLEYYQDNGGTIELEYVFGAPYTIFGQVIDGMDVVDEIAKLDTNDADKPYVDVIIEEIEVYAYETAETE